MGKQSPSSRPPWDWFSAILVFLLVWVAAIRLVITKWTPDLHFTETLGALGVVLGLALGTSTFRRGTVRWLVLFYTLVIVPWQLTAAVEAEADVLERLAIVGSRLWFALGEFFSRKPVETACSSWSSFRWRSGSGRPPATLSPQRHARSHRPGRVAMILVRSMMGSSRRIWGWPYAFLALTLLGRGYFRKIGRPGRNASLLRVSPAKVPAQPDRGRSRLGLRCLALPGSIEPGSAADAWRISRPVRERLTNAVTSLDSPYGTGRGDFYAEDLFLADRDRRFLSCGQAN
jgi:hypothetical protein